MVGEEQFLQEHFKQFYENHSVAGPPEIAAREFGVGAFGQKIVKRHMSFGSGKQLNSYLRSGTPLFVSYSCALYRFPGKRPMEAKEMLGADLVYEFDADDLPTECKQEHDSWKCPKCGKQGKGRQEKCDECGANTQLFEWFCQRCLDAARDKVIVLLEFLRSDFGFVEGISVNFSGRAGYHVHVRSKAVRAMSSAARIELIDYLTANNLNIFSHFKKQGAFFQCPGVEGSRGWSHRILQSITRLLEEGNAEKIAVFGGITTTQAKRLLREKGFILRSLREKNVLPAVFGRISTKRESQSDRFWQSFVQSIVERIAPIDRQTSTDINKIVRVAETLHGETGLLAAVVPIESLQKFSPLDSAVVFGEGERVKLFISKAPSFYLAGQRFGPFDSAEAELPLNAAIYLLGQKAAMLQGVGK